MISNKPDYTKNNIVNLMSSISNNFDKTHNYNELSILKSKDLKKYKNIILIVIDGLGYDYLQTKKDSFLYRNLKSKLTSTFPSTTACANATFDLGYPPQQSALTGWDIHFKEIGAVATILPFKAGYGGSVLTDANLKITDFLEIDSFHKDLNCKCYSLLDKSLSNSQYSTYAYRGTVIISTKNYGDIFNEIKKIVNKDKKRQYIHAYFPELDSNAHKFGVSSLNVEKIFYIFDNKIKNLCKNLKNTNSKVIVIADHGLIDTTKKSSLFLSDHLDLKDCLTTCFSGEPRVRHCFVRPDKVKDFKKIIKTKFEKYCWCYKGTDLIKNNFFGLGKPNRKLYDRVGDYVLILKENYAFYNDLPNKDPKNELVIGRHGGVSSNEIFVPLITIDC